jgi:hypothetical protein
MQSRAKRITIEMFGERTKRIAFNCALTGAVPSGLTLFSFLLLVIALILDFRHNPSVYLWLYQVTIYAFAEFSNFSIIWVRFPRKT